MIKEIGKYDNSDAIELLEKWLADAKEGRLLRVGLIGEWVAGDYVTGFSASRNRLSDAGMLLELAVRRLGFTQGEK